MPAPVFSLDRSCFAEQSRLIDPLTRTLARPALIEQLSALQRDADRTAAPFSVCLINVDQLKSVNDQWGQQTGDAVLVGIVARVTHLLEQAPQRTRQHVLGRYDGDGLLVASAAAEQRPTTVLAEQMRAAVANLRINDRLRVTASLGVSLYRIGEPLDALLARTEKALHVAKQFGRDCVEIAATPAARTPRPDIRVLAV
jgi:diguanylate cyclase (GGDEF)-like protein